ncbi:MAG: restriction endonuclease subunit S [Phycisphaeraceae bacterium]|nr:restriction endonuclease subunit S [Phycisphaeraceae bacterium]
MKTANATPFDASAELPQTPKRRFPPYPAYAGSGIDWLGDVPSGWAVRKLKYVTSLVTEKSNGDRLKVGLENVESFTGRFLDTEAIFDGEGTAFRPHDLLYGKLRPYLAKAFMADAEGAAVGDFFVLRPGRDVLPAYMQYRLLERAFTELADGSTFGAKMPRVDWKFLGDLKFSLPPLAEQRAIAAFLDRQTAKIDSLVAKKRRLIELLREKRTALISHAVTKGLNPAAPMKPSGIDWLGDVPEHWIVRAFRYSATIPNGQVDPEDERYCDLPLIAPNHIESGTGRLFDFDSAADQAAESGKYLFERGMVLYSKIRPALAKVCVAPVKGLCSADMYPISPRNDCLASLLMYYMVSKPFTTAVVLLSSRVAMPKINRRDLGGFPVLVPPMPEQAAIVAAIQAETDKMDRLVATVDSAIVQLNEHRSALISAAVTGKLDVRGEVVA